jgi:hypothetical protein
MKELKKAKKMNNKIQYEIFLSYSTQDSQWVKEFNSTLQESGLKTWFDMNSISPGSIIIDKMEQALRESQSLVIILSPNNLNNPNTFFELGAAIADDKQILIVLTEDFDSNKIPEPFNRYHLFQESTPQIAAQKVVQKIAQLRAQSVSV